MGFWSQTPPAVGLYRWARVWAHTHQSTSKKWTKLGGFLRPIAIQPPRAIRSTFWAPQPQASAAVVSPLDCYSRAWVRRAKAQLETSINPQKLKKNSYSNKYIYHLRRILRYDCMYSISISTTTDLDLNQRQWWHVHKLPLLWASSEPQRRIGRHRLWRLRRFQTPWSVGCIWGLVAAHQVVFKEESIEYIRVYSI